MHFFGNNLVEQIIQRKGNLNKQGKIPGTSYEKNHNIFNKLQHLFKRRQLVDNISRNANISLIKTVMDGASAKLRFFYKKFFFYNFILKFLN
jgi:hypothetical protein